MARRLCSRQRWGDVALEQRPRRGPHQPFEDAEAPDVWPCASRSPQPPLRAGLTWGTGTGSSPVCAGTGPRRSQGRIAMRTRRGIALSCLWTSHSGGEAGERAVLSGPTSCKRDRRSLAQALDLPTGCTSSVQIDLFQLSPKAAKNPNAIPRGVIGTTNVGRPDPQSAGLACWECRPLHLEAV